MNPTQTTAPATMLDYIEEQAPLFADVLARRQKVAEPFCQLYRREEPDRLCLIASGTSRNAALAAAPFMEAMLKRPVLVYAPSQVDALCGRPMAVVISQGGNSTNSLAVFDRLQGLPTLAMTGNPYGHVNKKGDAYLEIPCGEEYMGPKTKGYTITVLTLYLMALEAARQSGVCPAETYDTVVSVLQQAAEAMPGNICAVRAWVGKNSDILNGLKTVYVIGKKQAGMTAAEGALKLMETLLVPAAGYDFEEFLHGPTSSIGREVDGFYLLPPVGDSDYERMQRLVAYHRSVGGVVCTVGLETASSPLDCVVQTTGQWYTQPFEQILPMQVISAVAPANRGVAGVGAQRFQRLNAVMGIKAKNDKGIV